MLMTTKQMIKLLEKNGFHEIKQRGSHRKMYNPVTKRTTIVPMHTKDLGKGLEEEIMKQAQLNELSCIQSLKSNRKDN